jgi:hypothetical protein
VEKDYDQGGRLKSDTLTPIIVNKDKKIKIKYR